MVQRQRRLVHIQETMVRLHPGLIDFAQIRQLAERLGLNPSVCRTSTPALGTSGIHTSSQSSPECSPPCHGGDRGFKSHRGRLQQLGTVRQPAERPSSNLGDCGFDSLPCYLKHHASAGHWRAQVAVTHPPRAVQVRLLPDALDNTARSSSGSGCWPLDPATRVQIPYGLLNMARWWNW